MLEAINNSRPLVYLGEDLNDRTALTPSHFLSSNTKTLLIKNDGDIEDSTYLPAKISLKETLLSTWKEEKNLLEAFWKFYGEKIIY